MLSTFQQKCCLKTHRRNVVNISMVVFFVTLSVFTLISTVHSSVILGVIGHCGGEVREGKCNSESYMLLLGIGGVIHSDNSKSNSSVILGIIGHCGRGGEYVDVVLHMSMCDITFQVSQ